MQQHDDAATLLSAYTMRANPLFRVAIEVTRRFTKSAGEMVLTHLG